jgi:hypothetical protein
MASRLSLIGDTAEKPANDVLWQILNEGVKFIEDGEFHGDLTILVAKLSKSAGDGRS